jgi:hypothetical protein
MRQESPDLSIRGKLDTPSQASDKRPCRSWGISATRSGWPRRASERRISPAGSSSAGRRSIVGGTHAAEPRPQGEGGGMKAAGMKSLEELEKE